MPCRPAPDVGGTIRFLGKSADTYRAAVVVSADSGTEDAVRAQAPDVHNVLSLKPDPVGAYSTEAYLQIVRFLMSCGARLEQTLLFVDAGAHAEDAVVVAVEDLLWARSSGFSQLVERIDGEEKTLLEHFAAHLDRSGRWFHALKLRSIAEPATSLPEHALSAHRRQLASRAELRRHNLEALTQHHPHLARALTEHHPKEVYFATEDGSPSGVELWPEPRAHWGTVTIPYQLRAGRIVEEDPSLSPRILGDLGTFGCTDSLLVGATLPSSRLLHFLSNRPERHDASPDPVLHVVEEELDAFSGFLASADLSDTFADSRIVWFIGPEAISQVEAHFRSSPSRRLPLVFLGATQEVVRVCERIELDRKATVRQLRQELASAYDVRFTEELRSIPWEGQRPLRVWVHTTLFSTVLQHCARDIAAAFRRLGCETFLYREASSIDRTTEIDVLQNMAQFRPDVFFTIDALRTHAPFEIPKRLPFIGWVIDNLPRLHDPRHVRRLLELDLVYWLHGHWIEAPSQQMRQLALGVNEALYSPDENIEPIDEVALITNLQPFPQRPGCEALFHWIAKRLQACDAIWTDDDKVLGAAIDEGAAELRFSLSHDLRTKVLHDVRYSLVRRLNRIDAARRVVAAGFPLALYGLGWDEVPELRELARGPLDSGKPLSAAYQRSKVVLHVNHGTNLHPRVFECMAAGGLVIARACPYDDEPGELSSCFRVGEEALVFRTWEELFGLVRRAFANPEWRNHVIQAGRRRTLAEHTYAHRMRTVLTDLHESIERYAPPKIGAA